MHWRSGPRSPIRRCAPLRGCAIAGPGGRWVGSLRRMDDARAERDAGLGADDARRVLGFRTLQTPSGNFLPNCCRGVPSIAMARKGATQKPMVRLEPAALVVHVCRSPAPIFPLAHSASDSSRLDPRPTLGQVRATPDRLRLRKCVWSKGKLASRCPATVVVANPHGTVESPAKPSAPGRLIYPASSRNLRGNLRGQVAGKLRDFFQAGGHSMPLTPVQACNTLGSTQQGWICS